MQFFVQPQTNLFVTPTWRCRVEKTTKYSKLFVGRHLSYNEKSTSIASNGSNDRDAGFAAVEESFIGKRNIERGINIF